METPPCYSTKVHTVLQDAWKTNGDAVQQQKMMASYHCHTLYSPESLLSSFHNTVYGLYLSPLHDTKDIFLSPSQGN